MSARFCLSHVSGVAVTSFHSMVGSGSGSGLGVGVGYGSGSGISGSSLLQAPKDNAMHRHKPPHRENCLNCFFV